MSALLPEVEEGLVEALRAVVEEVGVRAVDRLASAHDASHYLLTPQAVATPTSAEEVGALLAAARRQGFTVTFRSGGTSLSGQSVTDAVLLDTRKAFRSIEVLDDGARVRCGPGAVVCAVNARLLRHGTKLGPDPASEIACTVGGVVANNSSGMACGIEANTYRTLESAVLVLPSGTVVDTGAADAEERLRAAEPGLHAGLARIRDELRADPRSVQTLRRLHSIKNTMGYGLNSFLDHTDPVKILEHLVIGSEGTLAFVAEAVFRTVPIKPCAATALLVFPDLAAATACLPDLIACGPATVELMDATSLRVAQRDPDCPEEISSLEVAEHCSLLVEFQEADEGTLEERLRNAEPLWPRLDLHSAAAFTTDLARRAALWHTRKVLFAAVAGNRPPGTTALLEDIAVPVERLGVTCSKLIELFDRHGYADAVVFGHAKDGNIHFMITEEFGEDPNPRDLSHLRRYAQFTEEMVELVLAQGGTLKAEHGTGRIMAPFVERQVGAELYEVMRRVKRLVDPDRLLNPGVLLSEDPDAHLRDLKVAPPVEEEVDRCVECGYCEPVCPSKDLTLTPRERIVLRRETARAEAQGDHELARTLRREYAYDGVQTCAVDGMCQTSCPVLINTGDLVRRLRAEEAGRVEEKAWLAAAKSWRGMSRGGGLALSAADAVPPALPRLATDLARGVLGAETVPRYTADLPAGGRPRSRLEDPVAEAVWFPSCTATLFGPAEGGTGAGQAFRALCERAGIRLRTPEGIGSLCCATPWKSKGHREGYAQMRRTVLGSLAAATEGGRLPVVPDASSCTEGLAEMLRSVEGTKGEAGLERPIRVIDAVAFTAERILPVLVEADELPAAGRRPLGSLTIHPTCSSTRMKLNGAVQRVAEAVAEEVRVPDSWGCCAFAGDRGMLHPELTASATEAEAAEVARLGSEAHASANRTCEIGMTRATGRPYRHVLELLAEALR